ncbi:MAG: hypothetical protein Q9165_006452 [Trypethelium subeluteriae]
MGRCIYGGIYDPDSHLSDSHGFRTDVISALRELSVPVIRYPGGNFTATYRWQDGIGPRSSRPSRPSLAWAGYESNAFGTDEFMLWCEKVGAQPFLCLNFGTGTLDEALAWLEYCNSDQNTYFANLRRKNGREKPWGVKYWALGNEVWGPWQVEQMSKEAYATKAYQWAKALKLLDPSIELVLCGETGYSSWDVYVLKECVRWSLHDLGGSTTASLIAMHSIHIYTGSEEHLPNVTAPLSAERAIEMAAGFIDLARIENGVPHTVPRQTICFDEWNVWMPERAPGEQGAEERYTLSDALAVGVWLNVLVRQSKYIGMATIAQNVNVIAPLLTTAEGIVKQTTWWPLWLFSRYMRGHLLAVNVRCPEYEGPTQPKWIRGTVATPFLDVSATINEENIVSMVVVNIHESKDYETPLEGITAGDVQVHHITGENPKAGNTQEKTEVKVDESRWDGKGPFIFRKHSIYMLRWQA